MTEQKTVAQEAALLLAMYDRFTRGTTPHKEITKLYGRYVEEGRSKNPEQTLVALQTEFARLFNRKVTWVLQYAILSRLHPDLLEKLHVEVDGFYLSLVVAIRLCAHDHTLQLDIWKRAQTLACGKQHKLYGLVYEMSQALKREAKFLASPVVPPPPPPVLMLAPPPIPAAIPPPPRPTRVPSVAMVRVSLPPPAPVPKNTVRELSEEDITFLKFLAQVGPPKRSKANEIAPVTESGPWAGGGRIIKS